MGKSVKPQLLDTYNQVIRMRDNLSHRQSHIDGNLSHRPSHADIVYMKRSDKSESESSFPNNFWVPEPAANTSTEKESKGNTKIKEEKEKNKTDKNNNNSRA